MKDKGKIIKQLLYGLIPIQVTSCITLFLSNLIDTVIVGNLISGDSLAVIGFVNPMTLLFNMIAGVIAVGSQILCGYHIGRNEKDDVDGGFTGCVLLTLMIGLLGSFLCITLASPLASLLGASGDVAAQTSSYIKGLCVGLVFWLFYKSMLAFLQLDNAPKVALSATVVMAFAKVGFDLLFVLVFPLGMFGVGLATSASYLLVFLIGFCYYLIKKTSIRFRLRAFRFSVFLEIAKRGFPNAVQEGISTIRSFCINRIALYYGGNDAVSVYAFASNAIELFFSGLSGICSASDILNSIFIGTKDRDSMKQVNKHTFKISTVVNLSLWVLVMCVADPIASLSGTEGALLKENALAIRLLFTTAFFNVLPTMALHFYRTLGCIGKVNVIASLQMLLFHLVSCAVLPQFFGVSGLWVCYMIGDGLIALLLLLYAARKLGFFPKKLTQLLYIPREFGVPEEHQWDEPLSSPEQIPFLCSRACAFLVSLGAEQSRIDALAECLGRLLSNIVSYGGKGSAPNVDVRVVCDGNDFFAVLRDNGIPFDPTCATPGAGLSAVRSLAQSMEYRTTLGLNVLTIRF